MNTLNQIVRMYLDANGISDKFFEQTKRVHEFLAGKHIKTVEDILNVEE